MHEAYWFVILLEIRKIFISLKYNLNIQGSRIKKKSTRSSRFVAIVIFCKAVPLQAWSGPQGSKKLRFPDFMTTAQDDGKVVSLMHRALYPQEINMVLISVRG